MTRLLAPTYWGGHLLMVASVALAVWLGFWQLGAWQAHREAEARDLTGAAERPLTAVLGPDQPFPSDALGRPVTVSGRWLDATWYVADREQGDRTGYWVVSPLAVSATGSAIPVVRGWAARPDAVRLSGRAELTGWLQASEGSGVPDDDPADDVLPELRIPSLTEKVDRDLYGGYLVARRPTTGLAAVRPQDVPEVSALTGARNLFYAVEWWFFGGFAVFLWWRWCRDQLKDRRQERPEGPDEGPPEDG